MPARIAYIMSRFPLVSETFILREMIALRDTGWDVKLYPLILLHPPVVHPDAIPLFEKVTYFPWLSMGIVLSNLQELFSHPIRFVSLWYQVMSANLTSPNFFVRAIFLFPKTVHMAKHMQQNKITHIHAHYATHPALMAWIIHQLSGISYSVTVHAHDIYVDRSMLDIKLRDASFIVAISDFNRKFLIDHLGSWVHQKIQVIHCGIDTHQYSSVTRQHSDGKFHIVSIGSLQPYKGMSYLIEACAILRQKGIPALCKIVGDGEERQTLMSLIEKYDLQGTVELVGAKKQEEVASLLQTADCYAQPSVITPSGKMEGIPVALMEALSSQLPVVASDISGISELVRPNETGYLVPPADPNALASTLEHIYTHPEEARVLGETGRQVVQMEFEIHKNVSELAELFSKKLFLKN